MSRKSSGPVPLYQAAGQQKTFQKLQQKVEQLTQIQNVLHSTLGDTMADNYRIGNFRSGTLIIECASAAWATRLQYQKSSILTNLRKNCLPQLVSVKIEVNPALFAAPITKNNSQSPSQRRLSQNSANHLKEIAKNAPKSLQQKLERLAKHATKTDER